MLPLHPALLIVIAASGPLKTASYREPVNNTQPVFPVQHQMRGNCQEIYLYFNPNFCKIGSAKRSKGNSTLTLFCFFVSKNVWKNPGLNKVDSSSKTELKSECGNLCHFVKIYTRFQNPWLPIKVVFTWSIFQPYLRWEREHQAETYF